MAHKLCLQFLQESFQSLQGRSFCELQQPFSLVFQLVRLVLYLQHFLQVFVLVVGQLVRMQKIQTLHQSFHKEFLLLYQKDV